MRFSLFLLSLILLFGGCISAKVGSVPHPWRVPAFIKVGTTTRAEVFKNLGEPAVYRVTAGVETAVYVVENVFFYVVYGEYESADIVIRFNAEGVVTDARVEMTGSGYGILVPPAQATIGQGRSMR